MNKIDTKLNDILIDEKTNLIQSVKEIVEGRKSPNGLSQMIGRRFGHIWEKLVKAVIDGSENTTLGKKIYFQDYINKFLEEYFSDTTLGDCCTNNAEKLTLEVLGNLGVLKQDLCDFTIISGDKKYAIDTKWRFISNDSRKVASISASSKHIETLGYTPILLIKRPREECLKQPIDRFEKNGWIIKDSENAFALIKELTGYDLFVWINNNIDMWNELTLYHGKLEELLKPEESWKF